MPVGPPSDPDRFDTFEECVDALEDDPNVDDPEAVCGAWENQSHAMTESEPQYRAYHQPDPREITVREIDEEEDGTFAIRMPIASTGEVRNEGDEPLTRDELDGMARQINERDVGVFLAHGASFEITDAQYGQTERLGTWQDAEVRTPDTDDERDHEDISDLLYSDAVLADPETLPAATGRYREALAIIKEQAKRDIPLSASIGWREDEDMPGGNDLMEASIVGIPADPRTVSQGATVEAMARAAVDAGADAEAFVEAVRDAVMGPDADRDEMSEDDTTESEAEADAEQDAEDTDSEEQTEREDETPEWVQTVLENQERQLDVLSDLADAIRQDDDEEEDDDDEDEDEEQADDDEEDDEDEENAANEADEEQAAEEVSELREAYDKLREGGIDVSDVDIPEPDEEQSASDGEATDDTTTHDDDDAAKRLIRQ